MALLLSGSACTAAQAAAASSSWVQAAASLAAAVAGAYTPQDALPLDRLLLQLAPQVQQLAEVAATSTSLELRDAAAHAARVLQQAMLAPAAGNATAGVASPALAAAPATAPADPLVNNLCVFLPLQVRMHMLRKRPLSVCLTAATPRSNPVHAQVCEQYRAHSVRSLDWAQLYVQGFHLTALVSLVQQLMGAGLATGTVTLSVEQVLELMQTGGVLTALAAVTAGIAEVRQMFTSMVL
jgi:hypothetical protein